MNPVSTAPAVETNGETALTESTRYLTFTLNGEPYALNIFHVTEILEHRNLTVVPMMPEFVRGVINLRGRAVPVIDLAIRFGRGATMIGRRTSIIIAHISDWDPETTAGRIGKGAATSGQDIGILVDTVNKVEAFSDEDLEPAPAFGAGIRVDYISGMAKRGQEFVIVLNIGHILSVAELTESGETMTAAVDGAGFGASGNLPAAA